MGLFDQAYKPAFGSQFSASMPDPFASMTGWGAPSAPSSSLVPQIAPFGSATQVAPSAANLVPAGTIDLGNLPGTGNNWLKDIGFLSSKSKDGIETQGWGGPALGVLGAGLNAFMGMKQYSLAKDTLEENKRQYAQNYDAQRQTTNSALEDRQRARVASNSGAYQSVGDYMDKNRIR